MGLIIRNIDNNKPEFIEEKFINRLYPGQKFTFNYGLTNLDGEWLKTGNYSIKVVADSISNEDSFQIYISDVKI